MKLISALIILFSDDPGLHSRMKEALETIKKEELRADSMLCQETIKAMRKLRRKK